MSLIRYGEMDDMYGRMDRMMNSMMNNMFSSDPYGMNGMNAMNAFSRFDSLLPAFGRNLYDMNAMNAMTAMNAMNSFNSINNSLNAMNPMINSLNPMNAMNAMNAMNGESYYCSSSVMSMSTDSSGRPQIYEASSSTRSAPGGVRETKKTVRDSTTGLQSMSIGHHIRDRGHVMERSRNHYTGDEEQNEEYINLEESEAKQFTDEWKTRMFNGYRAHQSHLPLGQPNRSQAQLALPAPSNSSQNMQRSKMSQKKQKDKKNKKPYKKV